MHYYTTNLLSDFIAKNILKKSIPDIETFIISQSKTQSSISDKKFQKQFFLALNQIFWQCVKIAPLSFNSNSAEKSESGHFFSFEQVLETDKNRYFCWILLWRFHGKNISDEQSAFFFPWKVQYQFLRSITNSIVHRHG